MSLSLTAKKLYAPVLAYFMPLYEVCSSNPILITLLNVFLSKYPIISGCLSTIDAEINFIRFKSLCENVAKNTENIEDLQEAVGILASEQFYNIIRQIVNDSIDARIEEPRIIYSKIIAEIVRKEEKIFNIESLLYKICELKEKDYIILKKIIAYFEENPVDPSPIPRSGQLTGCSLAEYMNNESDFDVEECTWFLYRFASLGLLNFNSQVLNRRDNISFTPTKYLYKIKAYLS